MKRTATLLALIVLATAPAASGRDWLGTRVAQRPLLFPRKHSFFSVDALNPDVVAWKHRYFMYFSGNDWPTQAGRWSTGLAVANSPLGPFRVTRFHANYLNGGTTIWRGRLWHLYYYQNGGDELATSKDGFHWKHVAWLPLVRYHGPVVGADFSLFAGHGHLIIYMYLVRDTGITAYALGRVKFNGHRFYGFKAILAVQPPYNVGEPDVFLYHGRRTMAYVIGSANNQRSIRFATLGSKGWRPCSSPTIKPGSSSWAPDTAIDPSVLQQNTTTYIYYGGGVNYSLGADLHGAIGVAVFRRTGAPAPTACGSGPSPFPMSP
jgi:hypothetical protein